MPRAQYRGWGAPSDNSGGLRDILSVVSRRRPRALTAILLIAGGCADGPSAGIPSPPPDAPDVARIVCEADGSTTLETPDVLVQRDGLHIRVVSHLEEPASVNGLGFDVDPGRSSWIAGTPGVLPIACWPFSGHGGPVPATVPLTVHDPQRWFVEGELQCTEDDDGSALDLHLFASDRGDEDASITPEEARPLIRGLLPDDEVVVPGFPDTPHHSVVVIRDGRRIASVGFAQIDGRWVQRGGQVCGGPSVTD